MVEQVQALTVRLPGPLHERLRVVAFEARVPMNKIVVTAIERELGNGRQEKGGEDRDQRRAP